MAKPDEPPLLPPPSTADFIEQCDREDAKARQEEHHLRFMGTLRAFAKKSKSSEGEQPPLPAAAAEASSPSLTH